MTEDARYIYVRPFCFASLYRHTRAGYLERQEAKFFVKTPSKPRFPTRTEPSKEVDDLVRKVIGAAIEVHRALGPGYIESEYEEALAYEIGLNNIPFERQVKVRVAYKGHPVSEGRLDFLIAKLLPGELILALAFFAPWRLT